MPGRARIMPNPLPAGLGQTSSGARPRCCQTRRRDLGFRLARHPCGRAAPRRPHPAAAPAAVRLGPPRPRRQRLPRPVPRQARDGRRGGRRTAVGCGLDGLPAGHGHDRGTHGAGARAGVVLRDAGRAGVLVGVHGEHGRADRAVRQGLGDRDRRLPARVTDRRLPPVPRGRGGDAPRRRSGDHPRAEDPPNRARTGGDGLGVLRRRRPGTTTRAARGMPCPQGSAGDRRRTRPGRTRARAAGARWPRRA